MVGLAKSPMMFYSTTTLESLNKKQLQYLVSLPEFHQVNPEEIHLKLQALQNFYLQNINVQNWANRKSSPKYAYN